MAESAGGAVSIGGSSSPGAGVGSVPDSLPPEQASSDPREAHATRAKRWRVAAPTHLRPICISVPFTPGPAHMTARTEPYVRSRAKLPGEARDLGLREHEPYMGGGSEPASSCSSKSECDLGATR